MMMKTASSQYDETRPLLSSQVSEGDPDISKGTAVTPLPKPQLAVVICIRLIEPVAYSQIFPYINEYLSTLHVTDDPKRIGFYSGAVTGSDAVLSYFGGI
ncbi:hypothetical protein HWV62_12949 [Athelia sp. TMB]|nr:hypothetical protein HWV62_12949 [Athelia sp. TMB]